METEAEGSHLLTPPALSSFSTVIGHLGTTFPALLCSWLLADGRRFGERVTPFPAPSPSRAGVWVQGLELVVEREVNLGGHTAGTKPSREDPSPWHCEPRASPGS